nr:carbohydrate porin [Pseudenhygromyxa sp. WMMC2535]
MGSALQRLIGGSSVALILLVPGLAVAAPPQSPPGDEEPPPPSTDLDAEVLRQLQERLDALEQEVEELREERDEAQEAAAAASEKADAAAEAAARAGEQAAAVSAIEASKEKEEEPELDVQDKAFVDAQRPPNYADGFHFGSYGRVVAAGDLRGRPGRDADIVARGSRFDESTYAELELRREDYWEATGAYTRIVSTVAFSHPIFHYNGEFDAKLALRNLYIEEVGLGAKNLSFWAGSRMYRGDDIYVLDWWPLDNLNTIGAGLGYQFSTGTFLKVHGGVQQPNDPFYVQTVLRSPALDQAGETEVAVLDRQKIVTSYKLGHVFMGVGESGGVKLVAYGETHHVRAGQRELDYREFEEVPADSGFVAGGEISLFTGKRSTHVNAWVRHAWNLAAYGDLRAPTQLAADNTTKGARELIVALGGNYEYKFFGLMGGAYFRRFRNASEALDFNDLNEGIVLLRPQIWIKNIAGVALEGSYQIQQRGILTGLEADADPAPVVGSLGRVGIMPFWAPNGRGSYARPHIRAYYMLTVRDAGARSLYAVDDPFSVRGVDHLIGVGAEWWFGSTSYFRD